MSESSTPEQRTEMPTDRRMQQLRKEGQLFASHELVQVISLITGFLVLSMIWQAIFGDMELVLKRCYALIGDKEELTVPRLQQGFVTLLTMVAPNILIIVSTVAAISALALMLQTNWNVKEKKLHFRFGMLNPITGVKRIISLNGVVNVVKALVKLAIILPIGYFALKNFAPHMVKLVHLSVEDILTFTGTAMNQVFWKIMYVLIALAIFDYCWGKFQWLKNVKMTKAEVKDERKAIEGDEETRRKIVNKGLQRIIQRIKQSVPQADVVVTNPTHYAVALKYDRSTMKAPTVVAKGKGFLALRIRELARESGVPVLERKPLARALFASTEVGSQIPYELFKAVAEVLAYVYRIKNPARFQRAQPQASAPN